ncbi:MAG: histidine kinase [Acidobacteria bacterium]|nr:histidine kinase [Acidobacteriota bacterium]
MKQISEYRLIICTHFAYIGKMLEEFYKKLKKLPFWPKKIKIWKRIWLGCNIFALANVFCLGIYYSFIKQSGYNWAGAFLSQLLNWNTWTLLIASIINFVEIHPFNNKKPVSTLIIYCLGGLKYSFIHNFFFSLFYVTANIGRVSLPFTLDTLIYITLDFFWFSSVAYIAIITFIQASEYYENYQKSELNYQKSLLHTSQLETQLVQAQLNALKAQLQPHFIFNALNSISALQLRDIRAAQKMIANLGQFLRLTLKNTNAQEIMLKEEITLLRYYLDIEQVRFQDRLTINFDVDEEVIYAKVPNLILQPLVENAIKHGISQTTSASYINISAKKIEDFLMLQVEDNGVGIANFNHWEKVENRLGYGLTNTKTRLEYLYGKQQKLELNNRIEGGLRVRILLPFQHFSENTLEVVSIEYKED